MNRLAGEACVCEYAARHDPISPSPTRTSGEDLVEVSIAHVEGLRSPVQAGNR